MILSAEIRFWWRGRLPSEVGGWFDDRTLAAGGGARTDIYLLAGSAELGIKRRGGSQTEVKALFGRDPAVLALPFDAAAEYWTKLLVPALDLDAASTLTVAKRRRLRMFAAAAGTLEEVALDGETPLADQRPKAGCNVELTEVSAAPAADRWWTAAFESFGGRADLHRHLAGAARLMPLPAAALPDYTGGYPAWLARRK